MGIWYIVLASCLGQNNFFKNRLMTTITWKVFYDKLTANFSQTVTTLGTASVSSRAPQNNSSVKHKSEASSGNFKHTCFSSRFWLRSLHRWLQSKKKRYMVLQKILSYVKNTKDKDITDKIKKFKIIKYIYLPLFKEIKQIWSWFSDTVLRYIFGVKYSSWKHVGHISSKHLQFVWHFAVEILIKEN